MRCLSNTTSSTTGCCQLTSNRSFLPHNVCGCMCVLCVACTAARVHPGETNASWMMKGALQQLLADTPEAQQLRETFVFKVGDMMTGGGASRDAANSCLLPDQQILLAVCNLCGSNVHGTSCSTRAQMRTHRSSQRQVPGCQRRMSAGWGCGVAHNGGRQRHTDCTRH